MKKVLRELEVLGAKELARRTGYSERTIAKALRTGKASAGLREELASALERRERAIRAAETRELGRTKIDASVPTRELAKAEGVSERTVEKWKERGGAPPGARDAALQLLQGRAPYAEPEGGKGRSLGGLREEKLLDRMSAFVEAVRQRQDRDAIASAYRAWRREKVKARRELSPGAWRKLVSRLGAELELPDIGVFSVQRFIKS